GLAQGKRNASIVKVNFPKGGYRNSNFKKGSKFHVEYRPEELNAEIIAPWTIDIQDNKVNLTSHWTTETDPMPFFINFNQNEVYATVLGIFQKDNLLNTPAVIHIPGQGAIRLSSTCPELGLTYNSSRDAKLGSTAMLILPRATYEHPKIIYTMEVISVYPELPGINGDQRFDDFRRNWLDALQLNPNSHELSNNTASDSCVFCYYAFSDIAALTPQLAPGLSAIALVKQTLECILSGGHAYGLPNPTSITAFSDAFPSMIIAAYNCMRADGNNTKWLASHYKGIQGWTESMLATDHTGNGLIKYGHSGNSGIWPNLGTPPFRPSNWWDTIGFGYEDAYANALAYRALRNMSHMAKVLNKDIDAKRYNKAADKIQNIYYKHFYNPETGVLAGWRSKDGQMHDYYFLWVNGIAIHYGLVDKKDANRIMDVLMAKMKEVGYTNFSMGLPGNLITVSLKDYAHKMNDGRFGGGIKPDNSDGFQNYENGGATGAYAYFTLAALYDLGRKEEADEILFPMLEEYGRCGFQKRDPRTNRSNDWRRWDGTPTGYEGLLTDDYYALYAVVMRQLPVKWHSGFRPVTRFC
ncbi:MAG: alpha-L-rhamnosidase-related protein, partial [Flavisolibacter sp.]